MAVRLEAAVFLAYLVNQDAFAEAARNALRLALKDQAASVRAAAATGLARDRGAPTEDLVLSLIEALTNNSLEVKIAVLQALGSKRKAAEIAVPALLDLKAQKPNDIKLLQALSNALVNIGSPEAREGALPLLLQQLEHKDGYVRSNASRKLSRIGEYGRHGIPLLIKALQDELHYTRANAAFTLGELQAEQAVKPLIAALEDNETHVLAAVCAALLKMNSAELRELLRVKAVPMFIQDLKRGDWNRGYYASQALGNLGPLAGAAVPALSKNVKGSDLSLRQSAIQALAKIVRSPEVAVPVLVLALKDSDSNIRHLAAYVLAKFGKDAKVAVPALIETSVDDDFNTRFNSARALFAIADSAALSSLNSRVVPALCKQLTDTELKVRSEAARTLAELGELGLPCLVELRKALSDPDQQLRIYSLNTLTQIGKGSAVVVSEVLLLLEHETVSEIRAAALALGSMGPRAKSAVPKLILLLDHEDEWVTHFSAQALRQIGGEEAIAAFKKHTGAVVPKLLKQLESGSRSQRGNAVRFLVHLAPAGRESVIPLLTAALKDDYWLVRSKGVRALAAYTSNSQQLRTQLKPLLNDSDQYVRQAVQEVTAK